MEQNIQNYTIEQLLENITNPEIQELILEQLVNQDQNYFLQFQKFMNENHDQPVDVVLRDIVIQYFTSQRIQDLCSKLKMNIETLMSPAFNVDLLSEENQSFLKEFMIFYHKYVISQKKEFIEGQLGYNYRKIPQVRHFQKEFNFFFNSFYQLMDVQFLKKFQKFFACQVCIGFTESPALYYLIYSEQNKGNKVFCGCIMCKECCQESLTEQTCMFCNSTFKYQKQTNLDDENYKVLSISSIKQYEQLEFKSLDQMQKEMNQQILTEGQIPNNIAQTMSKYFELYKDLKAEDSKDVFVATNLKPSFEIEQFMEFVEIQIYYYDFVKKFDEIYLFWKKQSENLTEQKITQFQEEFKEIAYNKLFQKLVGNRLLTSVEMLDFQNITLPNNDREQIEKYEKNNEKSFTLVKTLYEMFRQAPKKDQCMTKLGIKKFYEFILI